MKKQQLKGSIILILCSMVWGFAFSAQSNAMNYIQPFTFVFLRSTITCGVLFAVIPLFRRLSGETGRLSPAETKAHMVRGALIGVFLVGATLLQQVGLVYTTASKSGFITALYIVIVPLAGIFFGRRVRGVVWIGVALLLAGLVLLCVQDDLSVNLGDVLTLLAAFLFSCQIMLVGRFSAGSDTMLLSAFQFATCAVVSGVFAFAFETPRLDGILACWTSILYVAVFSGAIGYTLQILGQKYTDPTLASILMCLEAVFAALGEWAAQRLGWLPVKHVMLPREWLGCALMLAASIVAQLEPRRRREIHPTA